MPISGWENTAVATLLWSGAVFSPANSVRTRAMASIRATGVKLSRSVTSPMAQTLGACTGRVGEGGVPVGDCNIECVVTLWAFDPEPQKSFSSCARHTISNARSFGRAR